MIISIFHLQDEVNEVSELIYQELYESYKDDVRANVLIPVRSNRYLDDFHIWITHLLHVSDITTVSDIITGLYKLVAYNETSSHDVLYGKLLNLYILIVEHTQLPLNFKLVLNSDNGECLIICKKG